MPDEPHIHHDLVTGDKVAGDKVAGDNIHAADITNSAVAIGRGASAHQHHHYPPPAFPLDNLPPANPHFTGRADRLAAIHTAFQKPQSEIAITQAIAGLGGVGKTQLALSYAHAHRDRYDLIWLLQANEPAVLDGELRQLGMTLHLPVQTADAATVRQMVLSWLNGSDKRWLLLYDNADEITPQELRPYLPGGSGHVLITSRRPHWPSAQKLTLDVFTEAEAAAFWQHRLNQSQADGLAQLAAELGYLPLALELAAAYMNANQKTAARYLALYRAQRQALWRRQPAPDDYGKTMTTTWQMTFDHARQTPGAAALLNLCCFLAPDDIPLVLITEYAAALPKELAAVMADELALDAALAALQTYSLVQQTDGALTIHRLVQTVARDRMPSETALAWAEAAASLLNTAWPFDQYKLEAWPASARLLPHLLAVIEAAVQQNLETTDVARLNNEAGFYMHTATGEYAAARTYMERALAIWEKALGSDHPQVGTGNNNLAALLQDTGEYAAARPYLERALIIDEKALGSDHPSVATDLNNLGQLLQATGDYAAARPYMERALAIDEKALGPDHPSVAIRLNNLGQLLKATGDYAAARPYLERALIIDEKALGSDHPSVATDLNNLGQLLQATGDYAAARPYMERALAIDEKALGPDHPSVAIRLNNLGQLLQDTGDYAAARPYMERALAIVEASLGSDHPHTNIVRRNLAGLLAEIEGSEGTW